LPPAGILRAGDDARHGGTRQPQSPRPPLPKVYLLHFAGDPDNPLFAKLNAKVGVIRALRGTLRLRRPGRHNGLRRPSGAVLALRHQPQAAGRHCLGMDCGGSSHRADAPRAIRLADHGSWRQFRRHGTDWGEIQSCNSTAPAASFRRRWRRLGIRHARPVEQWPGAQVGQPLEVVRIVTGFPPGGHLRHALPASRRESPAAAPTPRAAVENKAGAGGQIAVQAMKGAPTDGQHHPADAGVDADDLPDIYKKLAYDAFTDVTGG